MSKLNVSVETGQLHCFKNPMICSSVNLLFFMSVTFLVVDGLH